MKVEQGKSRVTYTMPSNKHGIIKDYHRIEVEISRDMIGGLGLGFGNNTNRLSIQDKVELDNFITVLSLASKAISQDVVNNLEYGEKIEVGLFTNSLKKERYDQ